MASLASVPVEVVRGIVEYVLDGDPVLPIVGRNAAWVLPPDSRMRWEEPRSEELHSKLHPSDSVEGKREGGDEADDIPSQTRHCCSIKSLRSTSRFFAEVCEPFLYRDLNLMLDLGGMTWQTIDQGFPKWPHVRTISAYMDNTDPLDSQSFAKHGLYLARIISKCENVTSIALYYHQNSVNFVAIEDALLTLFKNGRLSRLGFYSDHLLRAPHEIINTYSSQLVKLLDRLTLNEHAQRSLCVLDLVTHSIPAETFDRIRSRLRGLISLTIRRAVRAPSFYSRVWDVDQQTKWPLRNLTRLQLAHFEPGHAAHIPPLVGHFTALKELTISACGGDSNFVPQSRPRGWSKRADALCNMHQALTVFHVEHMDDWEIYELGAIPTTTLIVTTVKKHHLLGCLRQDAEIFPGLRVLRLAPLQREISETGDDRAEDGKPSIHDICSARTVDLRRDAVAYWTCVCNSEEGY